MTEAIRFEMRVFATGTKVFLEMNAFNLEAVDGLLQHAAQMAEATADLMDAQGAVFEARNRKTVRRKTHRNFTN